MRILYWWNWRTYVNRIVREDFVNEQTLGSSECVWIVPGTITE